jgi:hypothetical protein
MTHANDLFRREWGPGMDKFKGFGGWRRTNGNGIKEERQVEMLNPHLATKAIYCMHHLATKAIIVCIDHSADSREFSTGVF